MPIDLLLKRLYTEELDIWNEEKERMATIEEELNELVEAAKVEESEEEEALAEALNAREDGFTVTAVRDELKRATEGTKAHELLSKVKELLDTRTKLNRSMKELENKLTTEAEERIEQLTNAEIDTLMREKWFGTLKEQMTTLIERALRKELDTLQQLAERYADTLDTIEAESKRLEQQFEAMLNELVVTNE